ncbi:MAG: hypothetical protein A2W91_01420 [Bacteroidetes bacterium GWF2_38_335]|nr:MAG: hypothetical protein A2W91_01420 [Bacteroidetes bacterium GWF2_38_335]OFY80942.1 MAG: hypothetical protein A2281_12845 [Bacteroidetes bacterium RIFOXYA12_FULL_38_20]
MERNKILTGLFGKISPTSINDYIEHGGYSALKKALKIKPANIIHEVSESGLRGRGGAGFPTGSKWGFTAKEISDQKYVICNADEGEPGTFKDRLLMENNPHLLIEGVIIAAYAIGASEAIIYIRGEYYESIKKILKAIKDANKEGLLGENIEGTDFSLNISIKKGAGSYLCGEELTLIESAEGKRGHPRIKPPFPAQKGIFGKPTLVNNVETLANIPFIIAQGAKEYKKYGVKNAFGTKLFTISGDVIKPGMVEANLGITLRELIYNHAGGVLGSKNPKAVLLGGAAGTFVDASMLDISMDYDSLAATNTTMGSGAIIVMNESRSIYEMLHSILRFFKHESCGKCVPCRVGCKQLLLQMQDLEKSKDKNAVLDELLNEAKYIARNSLCPLGQSPVLPVSTAIRYFKNELISK